MQQTVLVLGSSGKIGSNTAEAFWDAGWNVKLYDRATQDMTSAAQGVDVIVNGLNPPAYHDWERTIPAITKQVIAAAKDSGATVIIPGNVYNYGNQPGVLSESTAQLATTRKGRVRIEMEQSYRNAGVRTIVLRGGNFIDPAGNGDIMSMLIMRAAEKAKLTAPSDADTLQAYAYVPDWARAAVALAEMRNALDAFEDIPFPGHAFSVNDLRLVIKEQTGQDMRITRFPWWIMAALSPVWELAREMQEMRYLYEMPHKISSDKFQTLLPQFVPTDPETVMLAGLPRNIQPDKTMRNPAVGIRHDRTRIDHQPIR